PPASRAGPRPVFHAGAAPADGPAPASSKHLSRNSAVATSFTAAGPLRRVRHPPTPRRRRAGSEARASSMVENCGATWKIKGCAATDRVMILRATTRMMGTADTRREPDVGSQAKGGAQGVPRSSGAGVAGVRVAVSGPQRSRGPWAHTHAARKDPFQGGREGAAERV